jgi:hypothetical protein
MFFEYDPATNMASQVSSPLNLVSASYPCFTVRLLLLPSGQILFSNGTTDVEFYSPDPGLNAAWKPTVISFPSLIRAGQVYPLSGLQLNGLSQAVSYGDDAQMATNYPIVRLRNLTSGAVAFGRTFNHSTMAVATGNLPQTTNVQIPTSLQSGTYELVVIANGIPSTPIQAVIA